MHTSPACKVWKYARLSLDHGLVLLVSANNKLCASRGPPASYFLHQLAKESPSSPKQGLLDLCKHGPSICA